MKKVLFRMLLIVSVLASLLIPPSPALAVTQAASIEINSGETIMLPPGGQISASGTTGIPIEVTDLPDLGVDNGFSLTSFEVTWDPAVIQVDSCYADSSALSLGWTLQVGTINNTIGRFPAVGTKFNPPFPDADIVLFHIGITALGDIGSSTQLTLSVTDFIDANSAPISYTTLNAPVLISNNGTVSGTVIDESSTLPIAGMHVFAANSVTREKVGETITEADGTYTLSLAPGDYIFRTDSGASGLWFADEYYNDETVSYFATPVTVSTGTTVAGIDFSLGIGGAISGTVTDEAQNPLEGIRLSTNDSATGQIAGEFSTDASGNYRFSLPPGSYKVYAGPSSPSQHLANEYYNDVHQYGDATLVPVTASTETANIDIQLEPGGTISGTIVSQDSQQPLSSVSVTCRQADYSGSVSTLSDPQGNYLLFGMPYGQYLVNSPASGSWGPGDAGLITEYYDNKSNTGSADLVTIDAGTPDVTGINFILETGGSISGHVYQIDGTTPIPNISVIAADFSTDQTVNNAMTGSDGSYTISGLPAGQYRVRSGSQNYGNEYWQETPDFQQSDPVTVTVGQTTPNIDFTLVPAGSVSGTVTDNETGLPVSGISVNVIVFSTLTGQRQYIAGTLTDTNGNYTIWGIPGGSYAVEANGANTYLKQYYQYADSDTEATPVSVTAPNNTPGIDFSLKRGGFIAGTVTDEDSSLPISNIHVYAIDSTSYKAAGGIDTGPDGTYSIMLPAGTYIVMTYDNSGSNYVNGTYDNVYNIGDATPVTVTDQLTTSGIDFVLERGGIVAGNITDSVTHQLLEGIHVYATDFTTDGWVAGATTDNEGRYKMVLPAGNYRIKACLTCTGNNAYADEFYDGVSDSNSATPVPVTVGQTTTINFDLDPTAPQGGTISGNVTRADGVTPISGASITVYNSQGVLLTTTTSLQDGSYSVQDSLPPGLYKVKATAPGYDTEWYDNVPDQVQASDVTVTENAETSNINFSLDEIIKPVVSIETPPGVIAGSDFTVQIAIDEVTVLNAVQYEISFNSTVLRLDGISAGFIGGANLSAISNELVPGQWAILQTAGMGSVSGSGYLAELHFHAIGDPGTYSPVRISEGILSGMNGEIAAVWLSDSVNVVVLPGDANNDGSINILDITKMIKMILQFEPDTPGADTNGDGVVNVLDITAVVKTILRVKAEPSRYGGEIVIATNADISVWNPASAPCNSVGSGLEGIVLETILSSDWDKGPAGTGETSFIGGPEDFTYVKGNLVDSWSTPAPGEWILNVRQGVHFGYQPGSPASELVGGREMTAEDMAYSIEYMRDSPTSATRCMEPSLITNTTVERTGEWQLTVRTPVSPSSGYTWIFGGGNVQYVWPKEFLQQYGTSTDWHDIVGTGPYMLDDYITGYGGRYLRNTNYWDTNPVGPGAGDILPYPSGLRYMVIPDTETRLAALKTGKADWSATDILDAATFANIMQGNPGLQSIQTIQAPLQISGRVDLPTNPFSDVRVRKAMMLAIDHADLIQNYYGGKAEILDSPVRKWYTSVYTPLDQLPSAVRELYGYDPNAAKQLLADAGYPDGFKMVMKLADGDRNIQEAALLKQYMAAIGIDLDLTVMAPSAFVTEWVMRQTEDLMLSMYGSGDGGLMTRYSLTYTRGPSIFNVSHVDDPVGTDQTIETAYATINNAIMVNYPAANQAVKDLVPYLLENAFLIPMPAPWGYRIWQPWLKNFYGEPMMKYWVKYAWIDTALKKSMLSPN